VISFEEMTRYLTSVFKVMYETQPGTQEAMGGASPDERAIVTAQQAFTDADADHDGVLTWEEFRSWYSSTGAGGDDSAPAAPAPQQTQSLAEIRYLTNLEAYPISDVLEWFAQASTDGYVSREAFSTVFNALIESADHDDVDFMKACAAVDSLYDVFDTNGDGVVDFTELATGLSVLCGGSRDDKARAAFDLYDYNGDGVISLEEMTRYLTSVFKVMYETQPGTQERVGGAPAEELAYVTAQQAFADADADHDGVLTWEEFRSWYSLSQ
jgi:Ca2+-binding EF-hand superfamily protein